MVNRWNNRGIIRIIEASIAILIIFSAVLVISSKDNSSKNPNFEKFAIDLLEEIAKNNSLREMIILNSNQGKEQSKIFIQTRINNPLVGFEINVCEPDNLCALENFPSGVKEIFSAERLISSTIRNYDPKKIKVFLWLKG